MNLHCEGNGVGNIAKMLMIAELMSDTCVDPESEECGDFDDILDMYLGGMNVNQIARELGVKVKGIGHAHGKTHDGEEEGEEPSADLSPGHSGDAPGHDPEGPGNSENAPGHDKNGPGNSKNAPGHDPEGPGNSEHAPGRNK